jgi:sensor histidine kinase regulating citrate/malate metabolism
VPAFSLLIVVFMVSDKITTGRIIIITALGLLFINMLVFYLYDLILQEYSQKYKSMVLEREVSEYKHELSLLMESQRRIQGLKHDMRHHISALKNLSESGKHEELLQYLDNMTEFSKNKQGSVSTGNTAVDSILNYLIQKASDNEVAVETSLKIPDELSMEFFDLNVILGNLFDNAIDAAKETKDKRIKLDLEFSRNILYINLRNSCLGKDSIKLTAEGKLLTTKKEKETHGFGLQNVKLIIDKYSGAMKITHENHCFVVDCMLYLK